MKLQREVLLDHLKPKKSSPFFEVCPPGLILCWLLVIAPAIFTVVLP